MSSFFSYYFCGKAIDRSLDHMLEKTAAACPKPNQHSQPKEQSELKQNIISPRFKIPTKAGLCWFGATTVVAIATSPYLPLAASCAIGILGGIPFVRPLWDNLSDHVVTCYNSFSISSKLKSITAFALLTLAEYGILYAANVPEKFKTSSILALSNIPICGTLFLTTRTLRAESEAKAKVSPTETSPLKTINDPTTDGKRDSIPNSSSSSSSSSESRLKKSNSLQAIRTAPPTNRVDAFATNASIQYRASIASLKKEIKAIKSFVADRQDLSEICEKHLKSDKDNIVIFQAPERSSLDLTDPVDIMTQLRLEELELRTIRDECYEFINRNSEVKQAFEKAINAHNDPLQSSGTTTQVGTTTQGVIIEEVTEKTACP